MNEQQLIAALKRIIEINDALRDPDWESAEWEAAIAEGRAAVAAARGGHEKATVDIEQRVDAAIATLAARAGGHGAVDCEMCGQHTRLERYAETWLCEACISWIRRGGKWIREEEEE